MTITATDILGVTKSATKKWTRQRKAEERNFRGVLSRKETFSDRLNCTDVANSILPNAYKHASGGGKYTVSKRQLYYACREQFKRWTGRELGAGYFSNTLLVQYMNRHPETADWKVTADPRGTLKIPNTYHEVRIPCGTLPIDDHIQDASRPVSATDIDFSIPIECPSLRHGQRYQGVLYIEKEGFEPLLEEAKIAERFDLAILSCKGQSVVAARKFVDEVCNIDDGVPLFVVHDFDKAGFEISQRLTTVSELAEENDRVAYRFENEINVTDLGLRLADVEQYNLAEETVKFKGYFASDSIATPKEQEFLKSGRRVELNAFSSPQFVKWLVSKLTENGLAKRLVPDNHLLETAYRRSLAVAQINSVIDGAVADAERLAEEATIPKTLKRQLRKAMKESPDLPWDKALHRLAQNKLNSGKDGTDARDG